MVERYKKDGISFLDTLNQVNDDGSICTKVYRKPTHSELYLQFDSHHPVQHKSAVARTLFSRATKICSNSNELNIEEKRVFEALRNNGYPRKFLREVCNKVKSNPYKISRKHQQRVRAVTVW